MLRQISLLIILSFTMSGSAFAATPSIDLGSGSGSVGATVQIPITLTNVAGTEIASLGVDIGYDANVLGSPVAIIGPAGIAADKSVSTSTPSPGVFRVGVLGFNAAAIDNGIVAYVTFAINSGATPGVSTTLADTPSASDADGNLVTVSGANGSITVSSCTYTISPSGKKLTANGGIIKVTVTATGQSACPSPSVNDDYSWISQSGTTPWKNNKGKVKLSVQKNTSSFSRSGELSIGGEIFSISQDGAKCRLKALNPASGNYTAATTTGSFGVTVTPGDCGWNVGTSSNWIHPDTNTGTGSGAAAFHIDANTTGKRRTGDISISLVQNSKKQKSFLVNQSK